MSESSDRFKHRSMQDSQSIVRYLSALTNGFANGSLVFSTNGKRLVVKPHGLVELEVDAKRKGEGIKLNLKFRWNEEEPVHDEGDHPLLIETIK
jgi:amphi-Trp domain-containing protein